MYINFRGIMANDNEITIQKNLTNKERIINFYNNNKLLIYSSLFVLLTIIISIFLYLEIKETNKEKLANNYIEAKISIENGNQEQASKILKDIIFEDESTYSALSLFLILDENLIKDRKEVMSLFDHLLKNNKFDNEIRNLIIFKKGLFESNNTDEQKLLNSVNSIISSESFWKPHALLMLADFFASKKEYLKAKEFYMQILSLKNINEKFYSQARSQLLFIQNEK
tara:strand:+ start:4049 stop:4726 length:678 start_codon:yes stop_codon:yes gene_type:complete